MVKTIKANRKIGMLVHSCYLIDARVRRAAETLAASGFEVHVVSARNPEKKARRREPWNEVVNGVNIHRVPICPKRGSKFRYVLEYLAMVFWGAIRLNLLSLFKKFQVVHIHNMPDILVFAGLTLKWRNCPIILDVHDPMAELFRENYQLDGNSIFINLLKLQERICYKFSDYLLTVSQPMAENIQSKVNKSNKGVIVIHNFPNQKTFPIRKDRKEWPHNKEKLILLYCGTVTEHYRLDVAVRAIAEVSKHIPNVEFQILGTGNRLHNVLELARELGIGKRVIHLKPIPQTEVKNIMANADIGISTHKDGVFADLYFSTKILEFMTQGLPVLTSRTYTIAKYIPEEAIFYFRPTDVQDMVKQILFMYENPQIVLEKIDRSKDLLKEYSWENESQKLVNVYENIINKK